MTLQKNNESTASARGVYYPHCTKWSGLLGSKLVAKSKFLASSRRCRFSTNINGPWTETWIRHGLCVQRIGALLYYGI
jgi:hypothetical protein